LATAAAAPFAFRRSFARLSRFGLAKLTDDDLTVHRLTHALLRADARDPRQRTAEVGNLLTRMSIGRPADPATWPMWAELGRALWALGRPHDAIALERDRRAHFREAYGDDDPNTLAAAGNLAVLLAALGEHEQARALDEDTLARRCRILGDDHPDSLTSAGNLANRLPRWATTSRPASSTRTPSPDPAPDL
jgi:hypothetical protein